MSVQTVNGKAGLLQGAVWKCGVLKPGSDAAWYRTLNEIILYVYLPIIQYSARH